MIVLETERLYVQKFSILDGMFFKELVNSPNWIQYIGERDIKTEKAAQEYIDKTILTAYRDYGYGAYKLTLKNSETPIGVCGFYKRDYLENVDIGFALLPEYEGQGFAFEASKAVLDYGKTHYNLDPVLGITSEDNIRSQKLLRRIGLEKVDVIQPKMDEERMLLFSN